jgi:ABC-type proline/glycine betaine transport system permease subunit
MPGTSPGGATTFLHSAGVPFVVVAVTFASFADDCFPFAEVSQSSALLANVLQTIPSLALFGLLMPLPFIGGIGPRPAILALIVYAVLPIVRNTYDGLRARSRPA